MKTQQKDGSMWDFEMHNYGKPYGISFGLLTLKQSIGMPLAARLPVSDNANDNTGGPAASGTPAPKE